MNASLIVTRLSVGIVLALFLSIDMADAQVLVQQDAKKMLIAGNGLGAGTREKPESSVVSLRLNGSLIQKEVDYAFDHSDMSPSLMCENLKTQIVSSGAEFEAFCFPVAGGGLMLVVQAGASYPLPNEDDSPEQVQIKLLKRAIKTVALSTDRNMTFENW